MLNIIECWHSLRCKIFAISFRSNQIYLIRPFQILKMEIFMAFHLKPYRKDLYKFSFISSFFIACLSNKYANTFYYYYSTMRENLIFFIFFQKRFLKSSEWGKKEQRKVVKLSFIFTIAYHEVITSFFQLAG